MINCCCTPVFKESTLGSSCCIDTSSGLLNSPGFSSLPGAVFQKVYNVQYRCGCFLAYNQMSLWATCGTIWTLAWKYYRDLSCLGAHPKGAGFYVTARYMGQSNNLRLLTSIIGYICHPRKHATAVLSSRREAHNVIICHTLLRKFPGMLQDPWSWSLNSLPMW